MARQAVNVGFREALLRVAQGVVIGLGAVLPGVSGGVLCVTFGLYQPVMALLAHPVRTMKQQARLLLPVAAGVAVGFAGVARALGFLLTRYPDPSVCLFVGLIGGMLPSLLREAGAQGRGPSAWTALGAAFAATMAVMLALRTVSAAIVPGWGWYVFCGACLALSVIVPGLSFSTLLMPLGLYTPFVSGIGHLAAGVILPGAAGALATAALLSRAVTGLMVRHGTVMRHAMVGVVAAATLVIIPYGSFAAGVNKCLTNVLCLVLGVLAALGLERMNGSVARPEE